MATGRAIGEPLGGTERELRGGRGDGPGSGTGAMGGTSDGLGTDVRLCKNLFYLLNLKMKLTQRRRLEHLSLVLFLLNDKGQLSSNSLLEIVLKLLEILERKL
jgi:hypothetical protein